MKKYLVATIFVLAGFSSVQAHEKQFKDDWFTGHMQIWDAYKKGLSEEPGKRCLEVGSYEGRGTIYIAENFCNGKGSYVDAVDTWNGSVEHDDSQKKGLYERFQNNLKDHIKGKRVIPHRGMSSDILMKFVQEVRKGDRQKYDFIYIDASHIAKDVMMDEVLCWEILKDGGLLFFDDYEWGDKDNKPWMTPKAAIDGFLKSCSTLYEFLPSSSQFQVHVRKISNAP